MDTPADDDEGNIKRFLYISGQHHLVTDLTPEHWTEYLRLSSRIKQCFDVVADYQSTHDVGFDSTIQKLLQEATDLYQRMVDNYTVDGITQDIRDSIAEARAALIAAAAQT